MVNVTTSYPRKHFILKAVIHCWIFALLTAGFFTFERLWNESIHGFVIEIQVLQWFFVKGSKKTRWGRIILNSTKGETF